MFIVFTEQKQNIIDTYLRGGRIKSPVLVPAKADTRVRAGHLLSVCIFTEAASLSL